MVTPHGKKGLREQSWAREGNPREKITEPGGAAKKTEPRAPEAQKLQKTGQYQGSQVPNLQPKETRPQRVSLVPQSSKASMDGPTIHQP